MMGTMRVGHYEIGLSGSYGGDGLNHQRACGLPPRPEVPADRWSAGTRAVGTTRRAARLNPSVDRPRSTLGELTYR